MRPTSGNSTVLRWVEGEGSSRRSGPQRVAPTGDELRWGRGRRRREGGTARSDLFQVVGGLAIEGSRGSDQSTMGATIRAKLFRARFSRLFTVPRLVSVISAISSYVLPSSSRRTKTRR